MDINQGPATVRRGARHRGSFPGTELAADGGQGGYVAK